MPPFAAWVPDSAAAPSMGSYELAWHWLMQNSGWHVVHGMQPGANGVPVGHAWLVHGYASKGGWAIEPRTGQALPITQFLRHFTLTTQASFDQAQARMWHRRTGHHGPWEGQGRGYPRDNLTSMP